MSNYEILHMSNMQIISDTYFFLNMLFAIILGNLELALLHCGFRIFSLKCMRASYIIYFTMMHYYFCHLRSMFTRARRFHVLTMFKQHSCRKDFLGGLWENASAKIYNAFQTILQTLI